MEKIIAIALVSGCSIATVRAPHGTVTTAAPACTRNARLPITADSMLGLLSGMLIFATEPDREPVATISVAAVTALFVTSAIIGFRRSDDCKQAWDSYDAATEH